jgi:hypothetical protein
MDLNRIASKATQAVTPLTQLSLQQSTGYTTNPDGTRSSSYAPAITAYGSVQSLTYKDLRQVESLNLQGTRRAIYLEGNWSGLVRAGKQGGDLITMPDGTVWLAAMVLEHWPDWTKVAVTLQDDVPIAPPASTVSSVGATWSIDQSITIKDVVGG